MNKSMLRVLPVIFLVLTAVSCSSSSMMRKERQQQKERQVIAAIENRDYIISITRAHPTSGSTLTSEYAIIIDDDTVEAYLPYIGQAYYITFEDKGIDFKTELIDYQWSVNRNQAIIITFKARAGEEYYRFYLEIYTNGRTYVTLTPLNKQAITYTGELLIPRR